MYVYLIKAGHKKTDPVKIGYSKDPEDRLKALQTGNPVKLQLYMKIKCNNEAHARRLERTLHEMLGTQNLMNEWFRLKNTQIPTLLEKFANNEAYDQIEHTKNLHQYSSTPGENKYRKKNRGVNRQLKEMEVAHRKLKEKIEIKNAFIFERLGVSREEYVKFKLEYIGKNNAMV